MPFVEQLDILVMIRVYKREQAPDSLETNGYTDDGVKLALLEDQHDKCYICERKMKTDYQVEHLESRSGAPEKENKWSNLFASCNYCNDRKKHYYDDIPLPDSMDFEEVIHQHCDVINEKMNFSTESADLAVQKLIILLGKIYNGKDQEKGRNLMEKRFWKMDVFPNYTGFLRRITTYKESPNTDNYNLVAEDLGIDAPLLGMKYNFIKNDSILYDKFKDLMKWNR